MARLWSLLLLISLSGIFALAQTPQMVLPPDVVASQLVSSPAAIYPPAARETRIQGNVILRIEIDPTGKVSQVNVVRGHPMLTSAAVSAVRGWRYSPFTVNGQPVSVVSWTSVRFGNPANHDAEDQAELTFLGRYWPAMERAHTGLSKSDFGQAQQALTEASAALSVLSESQGHDNERWRLAMLKGELNQRQNHMADAEQHFLEAVSIEKDDKGTLQLADALSALAGLYFDWKKNDLSRETFGKAIAIYQKNYKSASRSPALQGQIARTIVGDSWMLSKIAASEQKPEDVARQCRVVLDYKGSVGDEDAKVKECELIVAAPTSATK